MARHFSNHFSENGVDLDEPARKVDGGVGGNPIRLKVATAIGSGSAGLGGSFATGDTAVMFTLNSNTRLRELYVNCTNTGAGAVTLTLHEPARAHDGAAVSPGLALVGASTPIDVSSGLVYAAQGGYSAGPSFARGSPLWSGLNAGFAFTKDPKKDWNLVARFTTGTASLTFFTVEAVYTLD